MNSRILAALTASVLTLAVAGPAWADSQTITPTRGASFRLDRFQPWIPFTSELLSGSQGSFTAGFAGFITYDGRYCINFPAGQEPEGCNRAIDQIWGYGDYQALGGVEQQAMNLPFGLSRGENGILTFSATGGGVVRIVVDGATALPEPASWAMMIGGVGLIGGAFRRWWSRATVTVAYA